MKIHRNREKAQGIIIVIALAFAVVAFVLTLSNALGIKEIDQRLIDREYFYGMIDDYHVERDSVTIEDELRVLRLLAKSYTLVRDAHIMSVDDTESLINVDTDTLPAIEKKQTPSPAGW